MLVFLHLMMWMLVMMVRFVGVGRGVTSTFRPSWTSLALDLALASSLRSSDSEGSICLLERVQVHTGP